MFWLILILLCIGATVAYVDMRKKRLGKQAKSFQAHYADVQQAQASIHQTALPVRQTEPVVCEAKKEKSAFVRKEYAELVGLGFERIFETIECNAEIKEKIKSEYLEAFRQNQYSRCTDILNYALTGAEWRWRWFEEWEERFVAAGRWPYAWIDINRTPTQPPDNLHAILAFVKVAEMRKVLKEKGLDKIPTNRAQVEELAAEHLEVSDLQEAINERISYFEANRIRNNKYAMIHLIQRSIDHCVNQLEQLEEIKQIACDEPDRDLQEMVTIEPSWDNHEGTAKWAVEQMGGKLTEEIFPPFYPGDLAQIRIDYCQPYRRY